MGTVRYGCGCSITTSMFGEHEVLSTDLCEQHYYIYSQDKTPRQMAAEISAAARQPCDICDRYRAHKHG